MSKNTVNSRKVSSAQLAQLLHAFASVGDLTDAQLESLKTQAATVMNGYFYDVCSILSENRRKNPTDTAASNSDNTITGIANIGFLRAFLLIRAETFRTMEACELKKLTQLLSVSALTNLSQKPQQSNSQKSPSLMVDIDEFNQCFPTEAINIYRDGPNNKALPGGRRPRRSSTFDCSEVNQKRGYIRNSLAPSCARKVLEMSKNCAISPELDDTDPGSIEQLRSICKLFKDA